MFHNNVHKDIGAVFSVYNTGFNTVDEEGTEEGSCDAKRERPLDTGPKASQYASSR